MGNIQDTLNDSSIQETQLSEINQSCQQNASSALSNVQITAIGSHLGNISLTNSLSVTDMSCVMSAVVKEAAKNTVAQSANQETKQSLPWQFSFNENDIANISQIYSYQQAVISQQCVEQASGSLTGASVLFVDTVTGDVTIANSVSVGGMSCNLSAGIYQTITDKVTQDASQKTSVGCCGCGFGMILPLLVGLVVMVVVVKSLGRRTGSSSGNDYETYVTDMIRIKEAKSGAPLQTPPQAPKRQM